MPQRPEFVPMVLMGAMTAALQQALVALTQVQGSRTGAWIDELEFASINAIKNFEFENVDMSEEVETLNGAIFSVKSVFSLHRTNFGTE